MSKKKIQQSNKSFGIVFFIVFLIIGLYPILNESNIKVWSIIVSILFLILGILNSNILTPLNKTWIKFGILLGYVISPIILSIIFFIIVLPTGIIMRLLKNNFLGIKFDKKIESYWIKKEKELSSMKNQF